MWAGSFLKIGMAEIVDCVTDHPSSWYAPAHWAFVLSSSRPLPFVAWRGQLGIRNAPSELVRLLDLAHLRDANMDDRDELETTSPSLRFGPSSSP